jgi:hypothetical protein
MAFQTYVFFIYLDPKMSCKKGICLPVFSDKLSELAVPYQKHFKKYSSFS